jgi:hypothetical protein
MAETFEKRMLRHVRENPDNARKRVEHAHGALKAAGDDGSAGMSAHPQAVPLLRKMRERNFHSRKP